MGDARRLGQAGGARGEDEERAVVDRQLGALVRGERRRAERLDLFVDARFAARRLAVDEDDEIGAQMLLRAGELQPQGRLDDRRPGVDDGDAMGERGTGEIGVDQRGGDADPCKTHPDRQIFRSIGHHQANRVAPAQAPGERPAGVAVRPRVELAVGEGFALADQGRPLRVVGRPAFEIVADRPARRPRDPLRPRQSAQDAPGIEDFALQSSQHAGAYSPRECDCSTMN